MMSKPSKVKTIRFMTSVVKSKWPCSSIQPTVVTMPVDPAKEVESVVGIGEDGKVETYQSV